MRKRNKIKVFSILSNTCRFILALTFIFSGFIKANDPLGTVYKMHDYLTFIGVDIFPEFFVIAAAIILALIEFSLGTNLLFGNAYKGTTKLSVLFLSLMTVLTVFIFLFNPVEDCGCFGDAIILSNGETLLKNIFLLTCALYLYKTQKLKWKFVGNNTNWIISLFCKIYILIVCLVSIYALPFFDFRPYKIGTNLREAFGNNHSPQLDIKIVYEKDGKTIELSPDDDDPDSTWQYVETKRTEMADIAKMPFTFYIEDIETEEDITEDVVQADGYTFLLVLPDLRKADESRIDLINGIYDYSVENGYAFYCITSTTSDNDINYWRDHTGAEYQFFLSDERELKTIVRSSPGLVLIKDGIIMNKWSCNEIPNETQLTGKLEKIDVGKLNYVSENKKLISIFLSFILPLILLVSVDRIAMGWTYYRLMRSKLNATKHLSNS